LSQERPKTPEGPALRVEKLSKCYGKVHAIEGVDFEIERGEVVGFLGPNGAGKSTTMRILCGLMAATSGRAYVCGIPVASQSAEAKRRLGYMPEHNPLPGEMRVIEYLRYRARLKEIHGRQQRLAVEEAMEVCDLHRKARRRLIGSLSKGYRQRVGIADAILAKPEVILMDEPTIGLDPHQILAIRKLIQNLRGKMTVMISSHILPEIELVCDRVIIINQGRVVASGTAAELRQEFVPRTRYRVDYAGSLKVLQRAVAAVSLNAKVEAGPVLGEDGFCSAFVDADAGAASAEPLLAALVAQPTLRIRELARLEPTLEDIFMAATRRSWDETLAPFKRNPNSAAS